MKEIWLYREKIEALLAASDSETLRKLESVTSPKTFRKGEYLVRQGEICRQSFWIKKGIVRKFYLAADGKEFTTELIFANDLAVSLQSYAMRKPSREFIEAIENTEVSVTDYAAFQELKKKFPQLLELDLMLTEYYAMWLEERLWQMKTLDATTRYNLLAKENPQFLQNVNLTYIASYLGVSLETLSRIRAKK